MITQPEKGLLYQGGAGSFDFRAEKALGRGSAHCLPAGPGGFVPSGGCPSFEQLIPRGERTREMV